MCNACIFFRALFLVDQNYQLNVQVFFRFNYFVLDTYPLQFPVIIVPAYHGVLSTIFYLPIFPFHRSNPPFGPSLTPLIHLPLGLPPGLPPSPPLSWYFLDNPYSPYPIVRSLFLSANSECFFPKYLSDYLISYFMFVSVIYLISKWLYSSKIALY